LDLETAGYELSVGENGIRAQAGASAVGGSVTVGNFSKERSHDSQTRVGLSAGPSLGARIHWGDSDKDGSREYGFGFDYGPISLDVKTEDPLEAAGQVMGLGGAMGLPNGLEEALEKNQAEFMAKRDSELADLEKNKVQVMQERGPQVYYRMITMANMPPEMRIP
jgi:hypothetical protein